MGKIIIPELIEMLDEGMSQREIAAHFSVSEPAVSMAVAKIRQSANRPEVLDRITDKELKFSMEIAGGASQTHAAFVAYDVTSRDAAKSLGCTLMKNDNIKEAISAILETEGLNKRYLVRRLKQHIDCQDTQASLKAVDMGFKLHDAYPASKTANLNLNTQVSPVDLSKYQ